MTKILNFFKKLFGIKIQDQYVMVKPQEDFTVTPTLPEDLVADMVKKRQGVKKNNK